MQDNNEQQTEEQRIKQIFKKHKSLMGSYQEIANFKEPTLQLIRRSGKVEFFENVRKGQFDFLHSDGTKRYIILNHKPLTFDYGKNSFKGYICDEDTPTPLPESPLVLTELINMAVMKTLNDIMKWKIKEADANTKMIMTIGMAIGLVIVAYAFYVMLRPEQAITTYPVIINGTIP